MDDATIAHRAIFGWTGDNPTKVSTYSGDNDNPTCEAIITYDLTKENKFNSTFTYFVFQDVWVDDLQFLSFFGKNVITSAASSCSDYTYNYNMTLQSNGLIDNVKMDVLNDNVTLSEQHLLWKFEYDCE